MRLSLLLSSALALSITMPLWAADPAPEIVRQAGAPQAIGVAHTVRGIPEACTRLEGQFTGDASKPYALSVVQTSPNCQPRARFLDAGQGKPDGKDGWVLNDVIRVPSAACSTQQAVVRVWRHPTNAVPPALDQQGKSRIYLADSMAKAKAHTLPPIPAYAATLNVEGSPCSQ